MRELKRILITGGCGFIGSAVIRRLIDRTDAAIINVDKLTYAGNPDSLYPASIDTRYTFEKVDICDAAEIRRVFSEHRPEAVMHLAAETHVDRSIEGPADFIATNIIGTYTLLESAREYWRGLPRDSQDDFVFHHVSTDEVYGELGPDEPAFTETTPYSPSSPYSASKASGDHLVNAWYRTYGLPTLVTNCSNNYGPYQFPEKLIPLMILNALEGKPLPVYGKGENIRDWLYVEDHAGALWHVLVHGVPGRTYNIGGRSERRNIDVVHAICDLLQELAPEYLQGSQGDYRSLVEFVSDRPGHDYRYAIDDTRLDRELGWRPGEGFESGLRKTVQWYLDNRDWVDRVRSGAYHNAIAPGPDGQGRRS